MNSETILVTGGYGCIGAETVKWLVRNTQAHIVICSRHVSQERTDRVFHGIERERVDVVQADVVNQIRMREILDEFNVTRVIHLAALQTPDCNAYRDLGLQINLAATQNLIEAMKRAKSPIVRFVFASSVAVYGQRSEYPGAHVPMLAQPNPVNVYGVWKLASEHLARLYCNDTQVPTVCLRPGVLFGPGRNAGLTSTPTSAMKSVALGLPYSIPFRSKQDYLFAPDVGAAFAQAAMEPYSGYGVFTLPSHTLSTVDFVAALQTAAQKLGIESQFQITVGEDEVPFICDLEFAAFNTSFPLVTQTSVADALTISLNEFQDQVRRGWLTADDVGT